MSFPTLVHHTSAARQLLPVPTILLCSSGTNWADSRLRSSESVRPRPTQPRPGRRVEITWHRPTYSRKAVARNPCWAYCQNNLRSQNPYPPRRCSIQGREFSRQSAGTLLRRVEYAAPVDWWSADRSVFCEKG